MIAYVDASVLLRVALGQPDALPQWSKIERGAASALILVESLSTLDRLRLRTNMDDAELARRRAAVLALIAFLGQSLFNVTIAIDIATSNPGAIQADLVFSGLGVRKDVRKIYSGDCGW